jgi:hypothetical protein
LTQFTLVAAVASLHGARPEYEFTAERSRRAVVLMPNARLHEVIAGHPPFLHDPTECGSIVKEFFSH